MLLLLYAPSQRLTGSQPPLSLAWAAPTAVGFEGDVLHWEAFARSQPLRDTHGSLSWAHPCRGMEPEREDLNSLDA